MAKKPKLNMSEIDGVQYRRAKLWQIILYSCNAFVGMSVYILIGYANYAGMVGYGMTAAVIGVVLTCARIFDGITDPLLALLYDKIDTKFGKLRILVAGGFLLEALALWLMFDGLASKGFGAGVFILTYIVYVLGYTITNMTAQTLPAIMSNDPKQRPLVGVWTTAFNYFIPMILSIVLASVILPMAGGEYNQTFLSMAVKVCLGMGAFGTVMVCIGITPFDKPEFYRGIGKQEPLKLRDMVRVLKGNKPLQSYIAAQASDKIAQITMTQSIIGTLMNGILIGNVAIATYLSVGGMLPSIIFAVIGGKYAGKHGGMKAIVTWTKVCIGVALVQLGFFVVLRFTMGTQSIAALGIPMILYVLLTLALNAAKMCVTTADNSFMADIVDYELDRSGKYIPAVVAGTYSLIDKLISSFGALLASLAIILCGYSGSVAPQPGDPATGSVFWVTMAVWFGLPIIGWIITLIAMKNCTLTKEEMVNVQKRIEEKKKESRQKEGAEAGAQA
ncbi:MAG: MFS transporter [Lachnospiraceae bacterium]|nr:MFS transporter [Lachnospiraceae bacterium]